MLKNSEIKKLIIIQIIVIFLITIISGYAIYKTSHQKYIDNTSYIIGSLVTKYPELENEIISSLIVKSNYDAGYELMNNYGIFDSNAKQNAIMLSISIIVPSLLLIGLINYFFIRNCYKKIAKIDQYMNNILANDYSLDIKDYCEGDISNLKNDTYKMTVKLKEQSELLEYEKKHLEETLEDISHQIKTPLTSMYMINDILENEPNKKIRQEFLNKNKAQIDRINWLISGLLKISRLENGTIKLKKSVVLVEDLIAQALEPINILLELKQINIVLDIPKIKVDVDKNWTSEALLNIIKNACEHTHNEVKITALTNPLYTEIVITDNGNGIDQKDLSHIFKRFYRGNHNKDSIGIGLNMSKKIIALQNGTITVNTKKDIGTSFSVRIYKNVL